MAIHPTNGTSNHSQTSNSIPAVYAAGHSKSVIALHGRRKVSDSAQYLLAPLRDLFGDPFKAQLKFLDVGCGPGSITLDFAHNYYPQSHFTGIEYTDSPIVQARARAKEQGVTNADFVKGDAQNLPFPDNSFDVVYCHQVLQHLSDPIKALSEMRRVCKPDGIVGAKETSWWQVYPDSPAMRAARELYHQVVRGMGANSFPGSYMHVWAKKAGFTTDQVTCSTSSWLFATPERREYWAGTYSSRIDPDCAEPSKFVKNAVEGGYATIDELRMMRDEHKRWVQDEDGWYAVGHGEIVCRQV